jgi:tetratricopeptide (TPR) repeat protein
VGSEARDLLGTGRAKDALAVLRKVRDRPAGSGLYLCEAQAYQALGDSAKALETIDRALEPAPPRASGGSILKLAVLGAEIETGRGPSEQAEERIKQAYQLASSRDQYPETLKLAVLRLRNWQALKEKDGRKRAAARSELIEELLTLPHSALEADAEYAQVLAGELGADSPLLLRAVAQMVGLPTLRRDRVRRAIILWDKEYGRRLQSEASALSIMEQSGTGDPGAAMEVLLGLLRRHPLPPGAARSLATEIRWALQYDAGRRQ